MEKWYEVEKTEKGIKEFLECNWEFHDFRAIKIEYVPGKVLLTHHAELCLTFTMRICYVPNSFSYVLLRLNPPGKYL